MTEEQWRLKLQNENALMRAELAILRTQQGPVNKIDTLRRENRRLREQVTAAQMRVARKYQ